MIYKKIRFLTLIILLLTACAAPQSPEETGTLPTVTTANDASINTSACSNIYFPIKEGTTYVYNQVEGNTTSEYAITYEEVSQDGFIQIIEDGDQTVSVEWDCTENGLVPSSLFETDFIEMEGLEFDIETTKVSGFLLPPADELEVGTSWDLAYTVIINANFQGNEFSAEGSIYLTNTVAAQETVTVPAGTYENAFRVDQEGTFSGSFSGVQLDEPLDQTYWFVENVGMVRNTFNVQGLEYSLELVEIR